MKAMLKEGAGLSNGLLCTLAVIAGVSVANLYYNQPLLDMLRQDLFCFFHIRNSPGYF